MKPDWTKVFDPIRLQNRILELELEFGMQITRPLFNLTRKEQIICEVLAKRQMATMEQLWLSLYEGQSEVELKIINVFICKARRKLPPEIVIKTIWGHGFRMPPKSREEWHRHAHQ